MANSSMPSNGVFTLSPTLHQWNENLNYESTDPNPIRFTVNITDNGIPPLSSLWNLTVVVVNGESTCQCALCTAGTVIRSAMALDGACLLRFCAGNDAPEPYVSVQFQVGELASVDDVFYDLAVVDEARCFKLELLEAPCRADYAGACVLGL